VKIYSHLPEETHSIGSQVAMQSNSGDVYVLDGDLGTGKTEFVRGFVSFFGAENVRSPSFSILNIYQTEKFPVYHFDFYRLSKSSELDNIGFEEYVCGDGVCLIEWGTLFPEVLPVDRKLIRFTDEGLNARALDFDFSLRQ
jgi:tRNA threonylcarbamoyladenosine biosynthesis protein TsaE